MSDGVPSSREELIQYLEQISGRSMRTRAELEAYLDELKRQAADARPARVARRWTIAKQATLGIGLLIAILQYYLIDIYVQILSLQRVEYLNPDALPAASSIRRSALEVLRLFC